jgi:hypothetical protein
MSTSMGTRLFFVALLCVAALAMTAMPAGAHTLADDLLPPLPELLKPSEPSSKRPAVTVEPQRPANRTTAPAALVSPMFVSATYPLGTRPAPIIVPDAALPWRFWVDRALAQRLGEQAVVDAVRQWDGIAGSRWATRYEGLVDSGGAAADGRSVIFLKTDCPPGTGGLAYWQTATGQPDARLTEGRKPGPVLGSRERGLHPRHRTPRARISWLSDCLIASLASTAPRIRSWTAEGFWLKKSRSMADSIRAVRDRGRDSSSGVVG